MLESAGPPSGGAGAGGDSVASSSSGGGGGGCGLVGIEPFLVATSVHMIVAQRLVRRICTFCKEPTEAPPAGLVSVGGYRFALRAAQDLIAVVEKTGYTFVPVK